MPVSQMDGLFLSGISVPPAINIPCLETQRQKAAFLLLFLYIIFDRCGKVNAHVPRCTGTCTHASPLVYIQALSSTPEKSLRRWEYKLFFFFSKKDQMLWMFWGQFSHTVTEWVDGGWVAKEADYQEWMAGLSPLLVLTLWAGREGARKSQPQVYAVQWARCWGRHNKEVRLQGDYNRVAISPINHFFVFSLFTVFPQPNS